MSLEFIIPQNLGSFLMKFSRSNFNLRSPCSYLVRSYLITTVYCGIHCNVFQIFVYSTLVLYITPDALSFVVNTVVIQYFVYYEIKCIRIQALLLGKYTSSRGILILQSFSPRLKSPKKLPNHNLEHLLFRWVVLRVLIWHLFLEI